MKFKSFDSKAHIPDKELGSVSLKKARKSKKVFRIKYLKMNDEDDLDSARYHVFVLPKKVYLLKNSCTSRTFKLNVGRIKTI